STVDALLAQPVIPQIHRRVVAGGARADDDHAAGGADEYRCGQRRFARVLEHELRAHALAESVPDRLAERPRALGPFAVGLRVLGARHGTPVRELTPVDDRRRAVLLAKLALGVVGDDRDRAPADGARDLERHAAEPAGGAPHQDDVAGLDDMGRPAHEHAVRGGGAEQVASRLFPGEPLRLGHALVSLAARELAEASVVGLVAPDARALGEHWILARAHPGIVGTPPAAVHDHLVADLDVLHVLPECPHDAGAVAAAGVEVLGLAGARALRDHVERGAQRGPDVVVVDARGHNVDQHLVRAERGRGNDLAPPGVTRLAEAILPDKVRVHTPGDLAQRRSLSELAKVDHALNSLMRRGSRGSSSPGW